MTKDEQTSPRDRVAGESEEWRRTFYAALPGTVSQLENGSYEPIYQALVRAARVADVLHCRTVDYP